MKRLTKRVGVGEAVLIDDSDFCKPFIKAGLCKTGVKTHSNGEYGYQRHCNDECILGQIIDRLADYEYLKLTPEEIKSLLHDGGIGIAMRNRDLQVENDRLKNWINDLQSGMYINCVYCGHRYGPEKDTPSSMADVLKQHIEQCPEHIMSKLKQELEELKKIVEYPRKEVKDYAEAMEDELRENDFKGGWKECTLDYLRDKLSEEVDELLVAARYYINYKDQIHDEKAHDHQKQHILSEAADVGNIAMMIADICKAL